MRRPWLLILATVTGCHACRELAPVDVEPDVAAAVSAQLPLVTPRCPDPAPCLPPLDHVTLPGLWDLALANNPELREAAA